MDKKLFDLHVDGEGTLSIIVKHPGRKCWEVYLPFLLSGNQAEILVELLNKTEDERVLEGETNGS
jgi:hypothetical protein